MNVSAPFIARPVATTLLTAGIALAGAIGFDLLPVAPLPQVEFPTIKVQASLPGASPETMAATVATPLERSLGRIAGISEMTSASALGVTRITLQFDLDRDIDGATRDVQAAINAARSLLPTGMPSNPSYRKVNPADAPIMILALTSDTLTQGQMYDAAATILAQKFSQVRGVGEVSVGGSSLPAVRVELNPAVLSQYNLGFEDVRTAIAASNANRPKGVIEGGERRWQILANDQAKQAADYLPLIIAYRRGAPLRLADVAQVVDSVQDLRNAGSSDGRPSVLIVITPQPGANIIETVERVKALLPQMRASIPSGIDLRLMQDRTPTIRASLHEVERSLAIAAVLVVLVVFLFLRSVRATLIASVAVPVSLIGTFGVMYLAGYSLNNMSLMALAVATGFVVDDAIVVLENISRHIEGGMAAGEAALRGAREVGFTVLSMTLSLVAVFIPILFMGGIVGRVFREFAVTLSVAILISLLMSLTTTPMMCALLLRKRAGHTPGRLERAAEAGYLRVLGWYERSLAWALAHGRFMLSLLAATVALNVYLYVAVPKGFFPQQDTGRLYGRIMADQSTSFQAMKSRLSEFIDVVRKDPAVDNVIGFTGGDRSNRGVMYVSLKPLAKRKLSAAGVIKRLRDALAHVPGAVLYLKAQQDIKVGARDSGAEYQYTLQADDLDALETWEPRVRRVLSELPQLADVNTDLADKGLRVDLVVDRDSAAKLGITQKLIDATLNDAFGQRQVSTIYNPLNQYRVVMEVAPQFWQDPSSLKDIYVTTGDGARVPLSAFSHYEYKSARLGVSHQGQFVASTISFNLPIGVSLSEATQAVNDAVARMRVPTSIHGSFQGTARAFQQALKTQPWLILAALFAVYIVCGILYESTVHPLTILSTLPSAGVGALLALVAFQTPFTVVALIGVILLIGIVKKNAIMMIDFALDAQRRQGLPPEQAVYQACLLRFRPIMMTTMAALLSAVPLAVGGGEGSELRHPLGIAIVGGLVASQLLTLYTTPVVYLYLDRLRLWYRGVSVQRGAGDISAAASDKHAEAL